MKKLVGFGVAFGLMALASAALAQQPGWGPGMGMGMGWGPMMGWRGHGPGWGGGPGGCPMAGVAAREGAQAEASAPVTEEKASQIATEYVKKYMKGYTVERVLPFAVRFGTAYQVELKGPKGETRLLHVNPWGGVRPFGPFAASQ